MVTTSPAMGPARPISSSARRCIMGLRMRMTAPNVPTGGTGAGRKNGGVTSMPYRRAMK